MCKCILQCKRVIPLTLVAAVSLLHRAELTAARADGTLRAELALGLEVIALDSHAVHKRYGGHRHGEDSYHDAEPLHREAPFVESPLPHHGGTARYPEAAEFVGRRKKK